MYKYALTRANYQNENVIEKIKDNANEFVQEIEDDIPINEYEKGLAKF